MGALQGSAKGPHSDVSHPGTSRRIQISRRLNNQAQETFLKRNQFQIPFSSLTEHATLFPTPSMPDKS